MTSSEDRIANLNSSSGSSNYQNNYNNQNNNQGIEFNRASTSQAGGRKVSPHVFLLGVFYLFIYLFFYFFIAFCPFFCYF